MERHRPSRMRVSILTGIVCMFAALCSAAVNAQTQPEYRAYWVDSLYHAGIKSRAEVDALLATVRASNMNAVVVQERRRGDTYYQSNYEPWATDADQSFDSLQYLCQQAHNMSPRVDVIVWFCTYPVWRTAWAWPTAPNHVLNAHPEWLMKFSNGAVDVGTNYFLDPGNPQVEQFTIDTVMDVVNRYDIDGINFDYVRYPEDQYGGVCEWGYNDYAVARFNMLYGKTGNPSNSDPDWKQFRRDQVTAFVRKMYMTMLASKPNCKMTADTVTWGNGPTNDSAWTNTSAYSAVFQDWRAWMEEGILDINMPMAYYAGTSSYYDNWIAYLKSHKYSRHLSIGLGSYMSDKVGVYHQLNETRSSQTWNGQTYYSDGQQLYNYYEPYSHAYDYGGAAAFAPELVSNFYTSPVLVPDMPWKSHPTKGHIKGTVLAGGNVADGVTVSLPGGRSVKTDGTGFYAFPNLSPGSYTVSVTYAGSTKTADVTVTAGTISAADFSFTSDPTAPIISGVRADNITGNGATIRWYTDDLSTSQVEYGATTSYGSTTALDSNLVHDHAVNLTGLAPYQTYHFRVRSKNSSTLETISADYTFTTQADSTPPVISNIHVINITENSATVTWTTDDPSDSWVDYGAGSGYDDYVFDDTLVTSHSMTLTDLTPNTVYHFCVSSLSSSGWITYSDDNTFMTNYGSVDIIVDDVDGVSTGLWTTSSGDGGWPEDDSGFVEALNCQSVSNATFTWRPTVTIPGRYNVYCWYASGSDRTAYAKYGVYSASSTINTIVNQRTNGSQWVKIADTRMFNAGTSGYIQLTNRTGEYDYSKYVIADAIRLEYADNDLIAPSAPSSLSATAVSASEISLTWNISTDNTGIAGYKVYRNGQLIAATSTNSFADTQLAANTQYSYAVVAYDYRNNDSAQSAVVYRYTLAVSPAGNISCSNNAGTWYSNPSFTFQNTGFGAKLVSQYRIVWDTSPTHEWTDAEQAWMATSIALTANSGAAPSYFHARSYNGDGIGGDTVDMGPYFFGTSVSSIAQACSYPDGTGVFFSMEKPLTAAFNGYAYIEEPLRTRGLRLDLSTTEAPGRTAIFGGWLATVGGERKLTNCTMSTPHDGAALNPLFLRISDLGGKSPDTYTPGMPGSKGAYNIGLLVRIVGKVQSKGYGYFVLGDGSGSTVRVYSTRAVSSTAFVGVTGIVSREVGDIVIRARTMNDVQVYIP